MTGHPLPQHRRNASTWRAFLVTTLLVAVSLAFSFTINTGSFRKGDANTLMSAYSTVGNKAADNIQEALHYGKPLDDFFGLDKILRQVRNYLPSVLSVEVALPDGRIVHTDAGTTTQMMPKTIHHRVIAELTRHPYWFQYNVNVNDYILYVPIDNPDSPTLASPTLAGYLIIRSSGTLIDRQAKAFRSHIWLLLAWTGGGTVAVLALLALATVLWPHLPARTIRTQRGIALALLATAQIVSGVESFALLRAAHLEAAEQATGIVAAMIRGDIKSVIQRGIEYRSLNGLSHYFNRLQTELPYLRSIGLSLDMGTSEGPPPAPNILAAPEDLTLHWRLEPDRSGMVPTLRMTVSGAAIASQLMDFALDMGTVLITSLLFMFELSQASGKGHAANGARTGAEDKSSASPAAVAQVRFMAFLLYFGAFLPVSFMPLMMATFGQAPFGLSPVQAAATPLTVEMLCGVGALLLTGWLGARVGWRIVTLTGFLLAGIGLVLSATAGDPLSFIAARGLSGAGTMSALMGINIAVGRLRGARDGSALQSGLFAGMYAGVNCGAVAGALMAATQGTASVFLAGSAILTIGLLYTVIGVPTLPSATKPATRQVQPTAKGAGWRRIAPFFLLISLPTAAASMFQPFYLPLYVSEIGLSSATVGRAYLLHGLCVVLLGPWLTRLSTRLLSPPVALLLSGLGLAVPLLLFSLHASLWTAFLAVFMIGVAESFGLATQVRQLERLIAHAPQRRETMLALHVNARKLGQAAGSPLFGAVTATGPAGIGLIGIGLGAVLLLYATLVRARSRTIEPLPNNTQKEAVR